MSPVGHGRAFVGLSPTNYKTLTGSLDAERGELWPGEIDFIDWSSGVTRFRALSAVVRRAGAYEAIVLDGSVGLRSGYLDLFAAGIAGRRGGRGPIVVVADSTWKRGVSLVDRIALRGGIELVDAPNTRFCVLSNDEVRVFPKTWGVSPDKLFFTPWPHTLSGSELETTREGGIFAGGDSLRDYGPLVEAARTLDAEITIATRRPELVDAHDLPANVHAGPLPHDTYVEQMRRATIVIVPLLPTEERSAGQTTYCNAMAMGKLVIATDTLGIRDYIDDRETGLLVPPGDAAAMRETLGWATDPANAADVERIADRAREVALDRLSPDRYVINLLQVARTALERREG
jgi:hypothetical protein